MEESNKKKFVPDKKYSVLDKNFSVLDKTKIRADNFVPIPMPHKPFATRPLQLTSKFLLLASTNFLLASEFFFEANSFFFVVSCKNDMGNRSDEVGKIQSSTVSTPDINVTISPAIQATPTLLIFTWDSFFSIRSRHAIYSGLPETSIE